MNSQTYYNYTPQADILTEEIATFADASRWQRLVNYSIDAIAYYAILIPFEIKMGAFNLLEPQSSQPIGGNRYIEFLFNSAIYLLVICVLEGATGGRSLGKWITGTVAIREDGQAFSWKDAFNRSLVRLIPIECLSIFWGRLWHDKWTNTRVVRKDRLIS